MQFGCQGGIKSWAAEAEQEGDGKANRFRGAKTSLSLSIHDYENVVSDVKATCLGFTTYVSRAFLNSLSSLVGKVMLFSPPNEGFNWNEISWPASLV